MGWRDNVTSFLSGVGKAISDIYTEVKTVVKEVTKEVQERLSAAYQGFKDPSKIKPQIDVSNISRESIDDVLKRNRIEELKKRQDAITKCREDAIIISKDKETTTIKVFEETYVNPLGLLSKIVDINPIKKEIDEKKKKFCFMQDEVNSKICLGNRKIEDILKEEDSNKRQKDMDRYVESILTNSLNSLLDLLEKSIKETNKYIKDYVEKHLDSELAILEKLLTDLKALIADKATKDQKLLGIACELAEISFIESVSVSK